MSKAEHSAAEKFSMIQEINLGRIGVKAAVRKYGVSKTTLAKWRRRYEIYEVIPMRLSLQLYKII